MRVLPLLEAEANGNARFRFMGVVGGGADGVCCVGDGVDGVDGVVGIRHW